MAYSKVSISNIALALIGAEAIRNFNEDNKRARLCNTMYQPIVQFHLAKFDWPFARKYRELSKLALEDSEIPYGSAGFALPADCVAPRDVWPRGSRQSWEVVGSTLFCDQSAVGLVYTSRVESPEAFSDAFVNVVSHAIAVKICLPITGDKALLGQLKEELKQAIVEGWEMEANIGRTYREPDHDPNLDSFVDPDIATNLGQELPYES